MQRLKSESIYLSKRERIGLISLLTILLMSTLLPLMYRKEIKINETKMYSARSDEKQVISKNKTIIPNATKKENQLKLNKTDMLKIDPNLMNRKDAQQLGIPDKVFTTLEKYRAKGAKFYSESDLKKVFGMNDKIYNKIQSRLLFPEKNKNKLLLTDTIPRSLPTKSIQTIEINSADFDVWVSLPGIGNKLAERIINFRNSLGGFYSCNQVKDVYGLADSVFQKINPYLTCSGLIQKIKINSSDLDELESHPYITPRQARFIHEFRKQNQLIRNFQALEETQYFTKEWLLKIQPYLDYQ